MVIYTCNCPAGQGGNPYLPNRCQESPGCASCKGYCDKTPLSNANLQNVWCAGLSIGMGSLFVCHGCYWLWRVWKKRKEIRQRAQSFKQNGGLLLQKQMTYNDGAMEITKVFTVTELEVATDNFTENRILRPRRPRYSVIAVKKSKKIDESQLEPFINEVVILSQINHRNVVKLLGCCLETEVPLLVYEFIPNGTLSQHIHNPSEEFHISWIMRLQIAAESAGAIAYLHSACCTPIYHRDIKSSNILLDHKYRAKVSDFGTSRTIMIDQTHLTTQVQGTFGYLDPDFGVVLVELLTSKKTISPDKSKEWRSLATEFLLLMENLVCWIFLILWKFRPTMKEVAVILEGLQ
ncbi:Wall-associated receptor kinase-like 1 [Bienertia sinuspersici]